jgi:hypothetical protein
MFQCLMAYVSAQGKNTHGNFSGLPNILYQPNVTVMGMRSISRHSLASAGFGSYPLLYQQAIISDSTNEPSFTGKRFERNR